MCVKRAYPSVAQARAAHRRAGYRLKVYRCGDCGRYHTSNFEKNGWWGVWRGREGMGGEPTGLAPKMTLEELKAEAARRRGL